MIQADPQGAHDQLRILTCADGILVAEVGPICVVIWRGDVNDERFKIQSACLAEVATRHSPNAALLCIVEPTAKPPNGQLRKASVDMLDAHVSQLRCIAGVCEGNGILTSIGRVVMTGMAVIFGRPKIPVSVLPNVDAAARWMQAYVSAVPPEMLVFLVEVARTNLDVLDLKSSIAKQQIAAQS